MRLHSTFPTAFGPRLTPRLSQSPIPTAPAARAPDESLTVLRARGRRLAKLVHPGGVVDGYDATRTFDLAAVDVPDLDALRALLGKLLPNRDCAVVRGAILDPRRTRGVRRLVHRDPETGDPPTLRECARRWLALDLDGLPLPPDLDARDLAGCGAHARTTLPLAFQSARMIVQASGSHGVKPGARLRLWAWLERSLTGPEVARWLRDAPVDPAVFRPAQLIYTAAPAFAPGIIDPLPRRLALLPGECREVPVPSPEKLAPPPPRPVHPLPRPTAPGASAYALAALTAGVARVASAAVNSRHYTMVAEARSLARFVDAGLLTASDVRRALGGAAERCGKTKEEAHSVVDWAMLHPSGAVLPEGVA